MDTPARKIALADDHVLFRKGMVEIIEGFDRFEVIHDSSSGEELLAFLSKVQPLPDIAIVDINMRGMNGFQVTEEIVNRYPSVRVLALSMFNDEASIIKMIRAGANGYILKDVHPAELKNALDHLCKKGQYFSEMISSVVINTIRNPTEADGALSDRETEFLQLCATELTYKEIADQMNLSPRTIDGYREMLFKKLSIKSRVGLVLYAIRQGIVSAGDIPS